MVNHYREYMDTIKLTETQHERIMNAMRKHGGKKPAFPRRAAAVASLAACLALFFAIGILPHSLSNKNETNYGESQQQFIHSGTAGLPEGQGSWPMIRGLDFWDATGAGELALDIGFPKGHFTEELSQSDIAALLGSGDDISWLLGWQGYSVTGQAIYDGEGQVFWVILNGESDDGSGFTMTLAPDGIPPTCIVEAPDAETEINGIPVTAFYRHYDSDGDGIKEYRYEFTMMPEDIGLRFEAWGEDQEQTDLLATLAANWCAAWTDGLSMAHLVPDEIPEWRDEYWDSQADAYADELGQYLPNVIPADFTFDGAHRELGQGRNTLSAFWFDGMREISVIVSRPDELPNVMDISAAELYDVRLYSIPWADSVPQEAWDAGFDDPVFARADMDQSILSARLYTLQDTGDTDGYRFSFSVLHEDGTVVAYSCKGLTEVQAQELVLGE